MGKKYFCISDVHSFFDEMINALNKAGYNKENPDHILISCGDIFDRGPDSLKVYNYLKSIPQERRILIRGNHEELLRDAVNRGYFYDYDYRNGTLATIMQITRQDFRFCVSESQLVCDQFKSTRILDWIYSNEWVTYFEMGKFIFVHSWIPLKVLDNLPPQYVRNRKFEYREDWREATQKEWEDAQWGCPYNMIQRKLYPEDKVIVCGHWSASDFYEALKPDEQPENPDEIYYDEHCIALDACTVNSGFCNVLVIDEDKCYDQNGKELKV